jgi:hypothetical protein
MNTAQYEPPISRGDFPYHAWHPKTRLAPGVHGFTYRKGNEIYIPLIVADVEGSGDVGRFLDKLSSRCVIESVTSARLRGMLVRRGFRSPGGKNEWRRDEN